MKRLFGYAAATLSITALCTLATLTGCPQSESGDAAKAKPAAESAPVAAPAPSAPAAVAGGEAKAPAPEGVTVPAAPVDAPAAKADAPAAKAGAPATK